MSSQRDELRDLRAQVFALRAESKRLRERTRAARGALALAEQLQDEITRLESQGGDYWKNAHDDQVRRKRAISERYGQLRQAVERHLLELEAWAAQQEPSPSFTDQVRQWALARLESLQRAGSDSEGDAE